MKKIKLLLPCVVGTGNTSELFILNYPTNGLVALFQFARNTLGVLTDDGYGQNGFWARWLARFHPTAHREEQHTASGNDQEERQNVRAEIEAFWRRRAKNAFPILCNEIRANLLFRFAGNQFFLDQVAPLFARLGLTNVERRRGADWAVQPFRDAQNFIVQIRSIRKGACVQQEECDNEDGRRKD